MQRRHRMGRGRAGLDRREPVRPALRHLARIDRMGQAAVDHVRCPDRRAERTEFRIDPGNSRKNEIGVVQVEARIGQQRRDRRGRMFRPLARHDAEHLQRRVVAPQPVVGGGRRDHPCQRQSLHPGLELAGGISAVLPELERGHHHDAHGDEGGERRASEKGREQQKQGAGTHRTRSPSIRGVREDSAVTRETIAVRPPIRISDTPNETAGRRPMQASRCESDRVANFPQVPPRGVDEAGGVDPASIFTAFGSAT